jgi:hypothetical protein
MRSTRLRRLALMNLFLHGVEPHTELEAVMDDLREIVALVEKEEGLTTD